MSLFSRLKHLRDVKPVPEEEREKLEKGDFPAMLIAALFTLILPALLVLGGFVLLMMLLFRVI